MLKSLTGAGLLALALTLFAQNVDIVVIEPADAERAAKAYAEFQKAETIWLDLKQEYVKKYAPRDEEGKICWVMAVDFKFSTDFKSITPRSSVMANPFCKSPTVK
jgi:hypothetical protein